MAKEQLTRSVPPPVLGDMKFAGLSHEAFMKFVFRFDRVFFILGFFWWISREPGNLLNKAVRFVLVISPNLLYFLRLHIHIDPQVFPEFSVEACEKLAFWFDRVAAVHLFFRWISMEPEGNLLFEAIFVLDFLLLTYTTANHLYFRTDIVPQESGKDKHGTDNKNIEQEKHKLHFSLKISKEDVIAKDGRNKTEEENTGQEKASSKESKEEVKARNEGNNEETTRQEKDLRPEESKEEVKPRGERNSKRDEGNTPQKKAELEVGLMELIKQVVELQKNYGKLHGWEEERSQLMYELGFARALIEIYREQLHGTT